MPLVEKVEQFLKNYTDSVSPEEKEEFESQSYDVWGFGGDEDLSSKLIELVLSGKKKATAGLYEHSEGAPGIGSYGIIRDPSGEPRCIIRYTDVKIVPFGEIDFDFATHEGEGHGTLEEWRAEHGKIFGETLNPQTPLLCEYFELVFPG